MREVTVIPLSVTVGHKMEIGRTDTWRGTSRRQQQSAGEEPVLIIRSGVTVMKFRALTMLPELIHILSSGARRWSQENTEKKR